MTPRPLPLLLGALGMGVVLCAAFVWPTPYRYYEQSQSSIRARTNRLTGRVEIQVPQGH